MSINKNVKILGIIGKRASGKDVVAKFIVKKHGAREIVLSKYISNVLDIFHIPYNRTNIVWFVGRVRNSFGKGILARAAMTEIETSNAKLFVLNGIRLSREIELLREKYGKKFALINVISKDSLRWQRVSGREEKTGRGKDEIIKTLEGFLKQEKRIVTEKEIPVIERKADYVIENDGSKEKLFKRVKQLMKDEIGIVL